MSLLRGARQKQKGQAFYKHFAPIGANLNAKCGLLKNKNAAGCELRGVTRKITFCVNYDAVAYTRFNSCVSRLKYESNVTKPVVP